MKPPLTIVALCNEARRFSEIESVYPEPALYGITDGKAVGTYLEHKFQAYLRDRYDFVYGSSAKGIDFPELEVDMKVTSIAQPQSSCPFRSARQKIIGLGYSLLIFVYEKKDNADTRTGTLDILHTLLIEACRTADYQITRRIRELLANDANEDDIVAFLNDRYLPVNETEAYAIARDVLKSPPPEQGYLTISNALQWRLQYARVVECAGNVEGIIRIR